MPESDQEKKEDNQLVDPEVIEAKDREISGAVIAAKKSLAELKAKTLVKREKFNYTQWRIHLLCLCMIVSA